MRNKNFMHLQKKKPPDLGGFVINHNACIAARICLSITVHFSFPIQTSDATFFLNEMRMLHRFTVGFGIVFFTRTESAAKMRVADFTASGDLHPAPKNIPFSAKNIAQDERNCKLFFSQIEDLVRSRRWDTKSPSVMVSSAPLVPAAPSTHFFVSVTA